MPKQGQCRYWIFAAEVFDHADVGMTFQLAQRQTGFVWLHVLWPQLQTAQQRQDNPVWGLGIQMRGRWSKNMCMFCNVERNISLPLHLLCFPDMALITVWSGLEPFQWENCWRGCYTKSKCGVWNIWMHSESRRWLTARIFLTASTKLVIETEWLHPIASWLSLFKSSEPPSHSLFRSELNNPL